MSPHLAAKRVTLEVFTLSPVFLQLCSPALADSLNVLKKRKKQFLRRRRRRERYKVFRTVRERQSKVCKTRPRPDSGPSDVSHKPAAAAQPPFAGNQITESFLYASFRIKSSLQAMREHTNCLMTLGQSSLAALLRTSSLNLCTVPRANWSSWWRTSTTAPLPKHLSPVDGPRRQYPPDSTAASTVCRRCTATSCESPAPQQREHVCFTSPLWL